MPVTGQKTNRNRTTLELAVLPGGLPKKGARQGLSPPDLEELALGETSPRGGRCRIVTCGEHRQQQEQKQNQELEQKQRIRSV